MTKNDFFNNGVLSGISLDGAKFFYENPLEINPEKHRRNTSLRHCSERLPITQRVEVFDCSCCPPNIARLIASIGDYMYTWDNQTVYIHHYASGTAQWHRNDADISLTQTTNYPWDGHITVRAQGLEGSQLALRIPEWCPLIQPDSKWLNGGVYREKGVRSI